MKMDFSQALTDGLAQWFEILEDPVPFPKDLEGKFHLFPGRKLPSDVPVQQLLPQVSWFNISK